MKKIISLVLISCVAVFLGGCHSTPEEMKANHETIERRLPPGCTIQYLGEFKYNSISSSVPVIVVTCKGRDATTLNWRQQSGKTTVERLNVVIN